MSALEIHPTAATNRRAKKAPQPPVRAEVLEIEVLRKTQELGFVGVAEAFFEINARERDYKLCQSANSDDDRVRVAETMAEDLMRTDCYAETIQDTLIDLIYDALTRKNLLRAAVRQDPDLKLSRHNENLLIWNKEHPIAIWAKHRMLSLEDVITSSGFTSAKLHAVRADNDGEFAHKLLLARRWMDDQARRAARRDLLTPTYRDQILDARNNIDDLLKVRFPVPDCVQVLADAYISISNTLNVPLHLIDFEINSFSTAWVLDKPRRS